MCTLYEYGQGGATRGPDTQEQNMSSTKATPVRRGNGTKVHAAVIINDKIVGTYCALDIHAGSTQHLRIRQLPEGTPVNCKTCLGDVEPQSVEVQPAPEVCERHHQKVSVVRDIKAGRKTTWACGCSHLLPNK